MQKFGMPRPDYRRWPTIAWVDVAEKRSRPGVALGKSTDFHASTAFADGWPGLILDIGSVCKLAGDEWLQPTSRLTQRHGQRPEQYGRGTKAT